MKQKSFISFKSTIVIIRLKTNNFLEMFMTYLFKKSINISDYGHVFACGAIYSQNVVLKTFLI